MVGSAIDGFNELESAAPCAMSSTAGRSDLPFVVGPALRQRLDLALHLIEFGRQTIVVTGPPGSGRSRVLDTLCAEGPNDWYAVMLRGDQCTSAAALDASLAQALVQDQDRDEDIEGESDLAARLADLVAGGRRCVVFIDDADGFDRQRLRHIEDAFVSQDGGATRFVLSCALGSPCAVAAGEGDAQDAAHIIELPALDAVQVLSLVDAWAGPRGVPREALVAVEEEAEFFVATGGLPGAVIAALEARLDGQPAVAEPRWQPSPRVRKTFGLIIVLFAAVGLVFLALDARRQNADPIEPRVIELELPPDKLPDPTLPEHGGDTDDAAPDLSLEPANAPASTTPDPLADAGALLELDPNGREIAGAGVTDALASAVEASPSSESESEESRAGDAGLPSDHDPAPGEDRTFSAAVPGDRAEEAPPNDGRIDPEPSLTVAASPTVPSMMPGAERVTEAESRDRLAAVDEGVETDEAEDTDFAPKGDDDSPASQQSPGYTSEWVLTQPDDSYVIQVFGSQERAAAERFIRASGGHPEGAAVFELRRDGAPWYVVDT